MFNCRYLATVQGATEGPSQPFLLPLPLQLLLLGLNKYVGEHQWRNLLFNCRYLAAVQGTTEGSSQPLLLPLPLQLYRLGLNIYVGAHQQSIKNCLTAGISLLYKAPQKVPPSLFSFLSPFSFCCWVLTNMLESINGESYCLTAGISLLYKAPQKVPPSLFSFLSPFSSTVWVYVGIAKNLLLIFKYFTSFLKSLTY